MSNNLKFKHWDNKLLFQNYERVLQIQSSVEEVLSKDVDIEDLPMSVLPTHIMYDLAACYASMYETLMKAELLTLGYPKQTNTYH